MIMTTGKSTSVYFDPKRALEEKNLQEQEEIKEKKEKKERKNTINLRFQRRRRKENIL